VCAIDLVARTARPSGGLTPLLAGAAPALPLLRLVQCDAALSADVAAVYGSSSGSQQQAPLPVEAVFHAGGVLADGTLQQLGLGSVRRVSAGKVAALARLLPLQGTQPGTAFVLFSSVAALLGSPGQANYSAANAALDAAAGALSASGVAAVSVQWGAWAGAGMAAGDPQTAARVARLGMGLIAPGQGLAALEKALHPILCGATPAATSVMTVVPFLAPRFAQAQSQRLGRAAPKSGVLHGAVAEAARLPFFLGEFEPHLRAAEEDAAMSASSRRLRRTRAAQPRNSSGKAATPLAADVASVVLATVAEVLGRGVAPDEPLMAAGLDSLGAVELRNALEARLGAGGGLSLPSTLVFDYPSASAISDFVTGLQLAAGQATFAVGEELDDVDGGSIGGSEAGTFYDCSDGEVAAIGAGARMTVPPTAARLPKRRLPASAASSGAWGLLAVTSAAAVLPHSKLVTQPSGLPVLGAVDAIRRVPYPRWDTDYASEAAGDCQVSFGAFICGAAAFDAAALGVSEAEAATMDPQQRLLLTAAAEALAGTPALGSGGAAEAHFRAACGVFVGVSSRDYFTLGLQAKQVGLGPGIMAGRK
jgi:hypothetical protein